MKVCIVATSLAEGGAERVAAMQSVMLSELGYEVHIVIMSNLIAFEYKGELLNLGRLKDKSNTFSDKLRRLYIFRDYLKENEFDAIIDNRGRNNGLLHEIGISKYTYRNFKTFYVVHSFFFRDEFLRVAWQKKWLLKRAYKIVTVSEGLTHFLLKIFPGKVVTIKNAVDIATVAERSNTKLQLKYSYILFCGRFDEGSKNISLLIIAFHQSKIYQKGIKLMLLGEGGSQGDYENLINSLGIADYVVFTPFTKNPYVYMKNALFTVLTSRYEGFPLVLIESLATGTPILAINCETGPAEIIENNVNGVLLDSYGVDELAGALVKMTSDKDFLSFLKSNSKESVQKFSKENISQKWKAVLEG